MVSFTDNPANRGEGRDLEPLASELEASGRYKILRQLVCPAAINRPQGALQGLYVDCETTGLKRQTDHVIELGIIPFYYTPEDGLLGVGEPYNGLRDPGVPIPEEVSRITGITDAMVAGQALDTDRILQLVEQSVVIVAHHANFDRPFLERDVSGLFAEKHWACSLELLDWAAEGVAGAKLEHIASHFGYFYEAHRAYMDCVAGLAVLNEEREEGCCFLGEMLHKARETSYRLTAIDSPFERKDDLYARGYRWETGNEGGVRGWWIDVKEAGRQEERQWLRTNIFGGDGHIDEQRYTALTRYRL